jgi:8-oxo-dGTP diphosphatase
MKRFPSGTFGRQRLQFFPAPFKAPLRTFAVLVFAWLDDRVVICDIEDRGWCIPSGRVEPMETSMEAAHREALEEGGVELERLQYIGCYQISERREVRWAECYAAKVKSIGEISMKEESLGMKLATVEELPGIYHLWNSLTEAVFHYSREVVDRLNDSRCS